MTLEETKENPRPLLLGTVQGRTPPSSQPGLSTFRKSPQLWAPHPTGPGDKLASIESYTVRESVVCNMAALWRLCLIAQHSTKQIFSTNKRYCYILAFQTFWGWFVCWLACSLVLSFCYIEHNNVLGRIWGSKRQIWNLANLSRKKSAWYDPLYFQCFAVCKTLQNSDFAVWISEKLSG